MLTLLCKPTDTLTDSIRLRNGGEGGPSYPHRNNELHSLGLPAIAGCDITKSQCLKNQQSQERILYDWASKLVVKNKQKT